MTLTLRFGILAMAYLSTLAVAQGEEKPIDVATVKHKVSLKLPEKKIVAFKLNGPALEDPKTVDRETTNPPTPSFDFRELNGQIALMSKNPFPKDMKFRAFIRLKGKKAFEETSIIPVKGGLFGIELWGDPIEEIVLCDFKLVDP